MNTELLKSKLLEAAFNGSLTHADTSTWKDLTLGEVISFLRTGLNPRVHFSLNTDDADGYYITIRELKGLTFEPDSKTDRINKAAVLRINERSRLKVGDVLLSGTATIGRTAIVHEEPTNWGIKEGVYALTPKHDIITSKYLVYYLHSPKAVDTMLLYATGSTVKSVAMAKLSTLPIVVPPLAEQQRIVAALEEGFAYIDAVASAKQNLSDTAELLCNKILQAAFDGSLTGADYSQSIVSLGDVCDIARGGSPRPIKQFITTREDGVNWIKIGDTEKGGKYINSCKEKIIPEGVKRSRMVHKGDFLLTNSMSFGRPYITNIDGCIHDGWLVISPHENTFDKDFLYYLLSSSYVFAQFSDKASGSTVSNLNIDKVIATTVPLPPLSEQQRIVAKIEELFTQIDKITK